MKATRNFEVIIIGGSYAGLSAAMALGRSLRSVLIIDSGLPCNRQTPHSHNFITQDGEKPSVISAKAKEEVLRYDTVSLIYDVAISGQKDKNGFQITTESGLAYHAKKLIFASGIKDIMPNIKGFAECWGISVVHCPYCHGYEIRSQKTAILANGTIAMHLVSLVNNLTKDLHILTNGKAEFSTEEQEKLKFHNIQIVEQEVSELLHDAGQLKTVIFSDGSSADFSAIYSSLPFSQNSDIPAALGCDLTEHGHIMVDHYQATIVKGVMACGD